MQTRLKNEESKNEQFHNKILMISLIEKMSLRLKQGFPVASLKRPDEEERHLEMESRNKIIVSFQTAMLRPRFWSNAGRNQLRWKRGSGE